MVVWWSFTFTLKRLKWHLHNCQSCEQRSRHLPFGPLFPTNLPRKHFTPHRAHSGTLYASHKPGPKAHTRQTELTMRFEIICMGAPQALGPIVKALAARPVTDSVSTMWLRTRRGTCSSSNLIFPWLDKTHTGKCTVFLEKTVTVRLRCLVRTLPQTRANSAASKLVAFSAI